MTRNPYLLLGLLLCLAGAILAPVFYLLLNLVPLAALAVSAIMLGMVSAMFGNSRAEVSHAASQMMLRTGIENIAALLEEIGLSSRAVYLPPGTKGARAKALIPLNKDGQLPAILDVLPGRLIARYGPNPEDIGMVVTTPGTMSLDGVDKGAGSDSDQIESALSQILVGTMDLADAVSVNRTGDHLVVEITNPKLMYDNVWYYRCLGSPVASIAATVASQALNKRVIIASEQAAGKTIRVDLEALK